MSSLFESIFGRNIAARQIAIVGVGILVTALVFVVSRWGGQPDMMPLFTEVPLASASAMTTKLTELGIPWKFGNDAGTTISVPEEDMAKARVAMAAEGLPESGRPGWDLFDKSTWGMTDFTQQVNRGRALEGELEKTIGNMRDVRTVSVHLALEQESLFKQSERLSKASVTLTMKAGELPSQTVVQGIARMVAASVGGLDAQHVTIVDERGHALTSDDDGTVSGLTSRQLGVQREIESSLEKNAQEILQSLVGNGNSKVKISANVNFDQVERTTQSVDPDKQATLTEQKSDVTPGTPAQGAAYNTTATTYDNTHTAEIFKGTSGNIRKISVAVLVADKISMPPLDTSAKTPPLPIVTARTAEELAKIETLVRNAVGVDSARGDVITVQSAPFDLPVAITKRDSLPPQSLLKKLEANQKLLVTASALVVLLIVAVVMVTSLKPKKIIEAPAQLAVANEPNELQSALQQQQLRESNAQSGGSEDDEFSLDTSKTQYRLPAVSLSAGREQAIATVEQRPDSAVRVTRNWLRT